MTRELIVPTARGWVGTRFHHQGRLKKTARHAGGVDCLGLLVGVADELGLCLADGRPFSSLDKTDYPHYPDTQALRATLGFGLREMDAGSMQPGDIALMAVDGRAQHLGIISDAADGGLGLIHAYAPAHAVVEHAFDAFWKARTVVVFRL
jgi:hypothetical protein